MLFESVVTNTVYYGTAFVLYVTGVCTPTLLGIALLFGIGNAFDTAVSAGAYVFLLKKKKINLLRVDYISLSRIKKGIAIFSKRPTSQCHHTLRVKAICLKCIFAKRAAF